MTLAILASATLMSCCPPPPPATPMAEAFHCQSVPFAGQTHLCYLQPDFNYPHWYLFQD
jgi:hypothetical protein